MTAHSIYRTPITVAFLILLLFMPYTIPSTVLSFQSIEEDAEMTMPYDYLVIGDMEDYSKSSIIVNNSRYDFCKKIIIFSPQNTMLPLEDIDAAEIVKLFINGGCVRKVKVLRFAT